MRTEKNNALIVKRLQKKKNSLAKVVTFRITQFIRQLFFLTLCSVPATNWTRLGS